jgi:hypothetical protein
VNPQALASVVKEVRREVAAISQGDENQNWMSIVVKIVFVRNKTRFILKVFYKYHFCFM